jgi:hypothetical protein
MQSYFFATPFSLRFFTGGKTTHDKTKSVKAMNDETVIGSVINNHLPKVDTRFLHVEWHQALIILLSLQPGYQQQNPLFSK